MESIKHMRQKPIGRILFRLFYLMILLSPFVVVASYVRTTPRADFYYFFYAMQLVWRQLPPDVLYNLSAQQSWFTQQGFHVYPFNQYMYPPQFAVFFSWLAHFRVNIAMDIWSAMAVAFYLGGSLMILALTGTNKQVIPRIIFYATALLNGPFWWDLAIGNANALIFFLLSSGLYLRYARRLPWLAGIPLGIAVAFKISPVVLLGYFFLRLEWKILIGALSTILLTTVLSLFILGPEPFMYYALHLSDFTQTSMKNGTAPYNSSPIGVLGYWHEHGFIALSPGLIHALYLGYIVVLALVTGLIVIQSRRKPNRGVRSSLALGVLTILLFSPLIEGAHLILLWISASLLFAVWWETDCKGSVAGKKTYRNVWRKASMAVLFGIVWIILSPLGWLLQSVFAWEYLLVLVVLLLISLFLQRSETQQDRLIDTNGSLTP